MLGLDQALRQGEDGAPGLGQLGDAETVSLERDLAECLGHVLSHRVCVHAWHDWQEAVVMAKGARVIRHPRPKLQPQPQLQTRRVSPVTVASAQLRICTIHPNQILLILYSMCALIHSFNEYLLWAGTVLGAKEAATGKSSKPWTSWSLYSSGERQTINL